MVQMPLFVLGLQPGGAVTVAQAQRYVNECRSRRRYYRIMVTESGPRSPETLSTGDIAQWAYQRAIAAMESDEDAAGGIGLQSNLIRITDRARIIPVRMAAAALVRKSDPSSPIILVTSDSSLDAQAKLVAQTLQAWRTHAPKDYGVTAPLLNEVAKRVVATH